MIKKFKNFVKEDTFAAAVPANAVGSGTAIAGVDPLLKPSVKKARKELLLRRFSSWVKAAAPKAP